MTIVIKKNRIDNKYRVCVYDPDDNLYVKYLNRDGSFSPEVLKRDNYNSTREAIGVLKKHIRVKFTKIQRGPWTQQEEFCYESKQ